VFVTSGAKPTKPVTFKGVCVTQDEILVGLTEVLRDVLDQEDIVLARTTTAKDVEGWDSLAQIRIMLATETRFGLRFDTSEMAGLPNVGALVDLIVRKKAAKS
jgi:acyl carrier protein